jgi:protein TonB
MSHQALLFCADEKTSRVVTQVLTELEFAVELCTEPFAAVKKLMAKQFDAIVVDCDNEQNATLLFKSARNSGSNQGSLAVAVVEGQAGVAKAFRIGANLVLTKPINIEQSKGTLRVARGLLKKAEASKPHAPSTTPSAEPSRPATTSQTQGLAAPPPFAKKDVLVAPFAVAKTSNNPSVPAATALSSSFEVEPDPTPQPEPAEAAFLESIPDPLASKPAARAPEIFGTSKESPWQPLSSPVGETKGSTPRLNSETAAHSSAPSAGGTAPAAMNKRPLNAGLSSGPSAGAATAPAKDRERDKETPRPAPKIVKTAGETDAATRQNVRDLEGRVADATRLDASKGEHSPSAPDFSPSAHEAKGSRLPFIAALAVIAIAAAGYLGWSKMHIGAAPPLAQNQPPAAQVEPPPATSPTAGLGQADAQTTPPQSQATLGQPQSQPATNQPQVMPQLNQQPSTESPQTAVSPSGKPAAGKMAAEETLTLVPKTEPAPLLIKKIPEAAATKSSPTSVEQTIAPPPLQAGPGPADQTIAGLVSNTSLPMPKHAPEVLRISQGITEGMLVKKVNPVYPMAAVQMHKQGTVQILANISKNGSITNAKLIKGDSLLAQAALAAVRQWKYKPYFLSGQPVEVQTQISVNFKLP